MQNEVLKVAAPYPHFEAKDDKGLPQKVTDFETVLEAAKEPKAIRLLARYFTQFDTDRTIDDVEDIEELEELIDQMQLFHALSSKSDHGYLLAPITPPLQNYFSKVLKEAIESVFVVDEDQDGKKVIVGYDPKIDVFPIGLDEKRKYYLATHFTPGVEAEPRVWDSLVLIAESGVFNNPLDEG